MWMKYSNIFKDLDTSIPTLNSKILIFWILKHQTALCSWNDSKRQFYLSEKSPKCTYMGILKDFWKLIIVLLLQRTVKCERRHLTAESPLFLSSSLLCWIESNRVPKSSSKRQDHQFDGWVNLIIEYRYKDERCNFFFQKWVFAYFQNSGLYLVKCCL